MTNSLPCDSFKIATNYNSDGIGNWLRRARIGYGFQIASQSRIVVDPRLPSAARTA
jgi:hypothetical protein